MIFIYSAIQNLKATLQVALQALQSRQKSSKSLFKIFKAFKKAISVRNIYIFSITTTGFTLAIATHIQQFVASNMFFFLPFCN